LPRIKLEDLEKIKEKVRGETTLREGAGRARITVHMGTCGIAAGARKVMSAILKEIETRQIKDVLVTTSGCAGLCSREPMVTVELLGNAPVKYVDLTEEKMQKIFVEHVMNGNIVKEYMLAIGSERVD
jgi:NADP-reducing hydrogenase subunit HndB